MCRNICEGFLRIKKNEKNFYCQECAKFIPKSELSREKKKNGRLRCNCCSGLVRNKWKVYAYPIQSR